MNDVPGILQFFPLYSTSEFSPGDLVQCGPAVKVIDYKGGHEDGDWSTTYYVVVEYQGRFYKNSGVYTSHVGLEWDGWREAFPKERTVTIYE
jgi:hypothetical protein